MAEIFAGRYTAKTDESFVVFLIGMRVNKPWQIQKWWSVANAMPPMLKTLYEHPEKGFLGGYTALQWPGVVSVQYWRSFADLERFARAPQDPHLPAWKRFNQSIGNDGSVGIWHETYMVQAGAYECLYGNMPRFGLGTIFEHVPAPGGMATARARTEHMSVEAKPAHEESIYV